MISESHISYDLRRFFYTLNLKVIGNLKTVIIMAKLELKFMCQLSDEDFISMKIDEDGDLIIQITESNRTSRVFLDKSTSIKLAKTLRTEINNMK